MLARKQVAWCKSTPPAEAVDAFTRRGYKVLPSISYAKLRSQADMSGVGAVVFTQSQVKPSLISRELNDHVRRLLDLDCRVIVLPLRVGDRGIPNVVNALVPMVLPATNQQGNPPLPYASIYEPTVGWEEIANFVVEAPPGPPPNLGLNIEFEGKAETKDAILLLRRAFADCVNVHLSRLHEGKSRTSAFTKHVWNSSTVPSGVGRTPISSRSALAPRSMASLRTMYSTSTHTFPSTSALSHSTSLLSWRDRRCHRRSLRR